MKQNIIVGVAASVACYKALDVIGRLRKLGANIDVVLTKEVEEFIRPVLFQAVSGSRVIPGDLFRVHGEWDSAHISLADKADLVLVVPATANIIGKIAGGICDDMLTCVICATKAKVLLAPAMNTGMYRNKIVQQNILKLKKIGYKFTGPIKGRLACGYEGLGHIQDVDVILKEVKGLLKL